ncbi:MAG: hypothetical protein AAGL17_09595, partial [Cyanobacteria bacterium J06576_12]
MSTENLSASRKFAQEPDEEGGLQLGQFIATLKRRMLLIIGITVLTASGAIVKSVTEDPVYQSKF